MTAQRLQAKRQSQLAARMLLTKVLPAQRPLRVLITSVGPGEGRTTLADALVEELHLAATMNSDTTASDVVVVDGPPYLGPSSRSLSPRDLMEIDVCLVIVRRRSCRQSSLQELLDWLKSFEIAVPAVVWNDSPPRTGLFATLWNRLRGDNFQQVGATSVQSS